MVRYRLVYEDTEGTTHRYYSNSLDYLNSLRADSTTPYVPGSTEGKPVPSAPQSWLEERTINDDTYVRMKE